MIYCIYVKLRTSKSRNNFHWTKFSWKSMNCWKGISISWNSLPFRNCSLGYSCFVFKSMRLFLGFLSFCCSFIPFFFALLSISFSFHFNCLVNGRGFFCNGSGFIWNWNWKWNVPSVSVFHTQLVPLNSVCYCHHDFGAIVKCRFWVYNPVLACLNFKTLFFSISIAHVRWARSRTHACTHARFFYASNFSCWQSQRIGFCHHENNENHLEMVLCEPYHLICA